MSYQSISIRTHDGISIQYPLNPLKRRTTLVKDLVETGYDLTPLEIPHTNDQLQQFLSLLETGTLDELNRKQAHDALLVADFFGLCLNELEMARILDKFGPKAERFIQVEGFKDISISALIYLILNQDELEGFVTTTFAETLHKSVDEFSTDYPTYKDIKYRDIGDTFLNVCPILHRTLLKECFAKITALDSECKHDHPPIVAACNLLKIFLEKYLFSPK